jgi:hypothetical protein
MFAGDPLGNGHTMSAPGRDPLGTDERRRLRRCLLDRVRRGYSAAYGSSVTSNPSGLFRSLMLSTPSSGRHRSARRAAAHDAGRLATTVLDRYLEDQRRLRADARRDPAGERRMLARPPGITNAAVDVFLQDTQVILQEARPCESENVAWLPGVVARVDRDDRYDAVSALACG